MTNLKELDLGGCGITTIQGTRQQVTTQIPCDIIMALIFTYVQCQIKTNF